VPYFAGLFLWDNFSVFFKLLFVAAGTFTVAMAQMNREVEDYEFSECCLLVASVTLGMVLLASSVDL
jgi:NADH:ubiquinone oxidoreductase subunit 2 (subunit N)